MKLESLKIMDESGLTYQARISKRAASKFAFWNRATVEETYVGNSLGWYNPDTGARLAIPELIITLDNAVRREYLKELMNKHNKPKLTPVK